MKGPLVVYRFLFLLLNCILAFKVAGRIWIQLQIPDVHDADIKPKIDWNAVHLKFPPKLHSDLAERLLLNEFLAAKQYDCKDSLRLGEGKEKYILCGELKPFRSAASVSGDKLASGDLESQLGAEKWIVFTPEGSQVVDKLSGDVEVNYLTELDEWRYWHTWDFEQVFKKRRLDVVKFDLYTSSFQSEDQPDVIRKLVPMMDAKQLLITLAIGRNEDVITKWYKLLYWLFFEHGYALVGAVPKGVCGSTPHNCKYRISLAKVGLKEIKSAPVFGMGSPLEEQRRLIKFIEDSQNICDAVLQTPAFPSFCFTNKIQTLMVVTFKRWDVESLPRDLSQLKEVHVVSPIAPGIRKEVIHHPWIISERNNTDSNNFRSFKDLLSDIGKHIDLLVVDMEGGEWELLPKIVEFFSNFSQITVSGRIFPEENENYRKFYWNLHRMSTLGFRAMMGEVLLPDYSIVFVKL